MGDAWMSSMGTFDDMESPVAAILFAATLAAYKATLFPSIPVRWILLVLRAMVLILVLLGIRAGWRQWRARR